MGMKIDSSKDEVLPPEITLPKVSNLTLPRTSDVPYLDDFDDSGLARFLEHELENSFLNSNKS